MKLFFRFFWMAITNVLFIIGNIIYWAFPAAVGFTLCYILQQHIEHLTAGIISFIVAAIGYFLCVTIPHCIDAIRYVNEAKTDSLEEAWSRTSLL